MKKANLYQIYYNQETLDSLDSAFIPLNNLENPHPNWGEFFVIRNFLKNNELNEDEKYGFFSPKFHQKTGLTGTQAHTFITSSTLDTDIALLSPFWEQNALFQNVFEQGEFWHPGLMKAAQSFFLAANEKYNLNNIIMCSTNTVYCNYFAAKPIFWRSWLKLADILFDFSENPSHHLHQNLNSHTSHDNKKNYSFKIFIQERLASYLLSTQEWRIENYPIFQIKASSPDLIPMRSLLIVCDALKAQYIRTGQQDYIHEYFELRNHIASNINLKFSQ